MNETQEYHAMGDETKEHLNQLINAAGDRFAAMEKEKQQMQLVTLGQKVKDKITGFSGRVTGRAEYLTGCAQVLVQPEQVGADQKWVDGHWLDETRVEITDVNALVLDRPADAKNGADIEAPIK